MNLLGETLKNVNSSFSSLLKKREEEMGVQRRQIHPLLFNASLVKKFTPGSSCQATGGDCLSFSFYKCHKLSFVQNAYFNSERVRKSANSNVCQHQQNLISFIYYIHFHLTWVLFFSREFLALSTRTWVFIFLKKHFFQPLVKKKQQPQNIDKNTQENAICYLLYSVYWETLGE